PVREPSTSSRPPGASMSMSGFRYDDHHGLICAFDLAPPTPRVDDMLAGPKGGRPAWLHFNLSDGRAMRWIEESAELPAHAKALFTDPGQRIHVEVFPDGIAAVLGDLHHEFSGDPENFGTIRLYLDRERMVSGRHHPLKTSDLVRRDLKSGAHEIDSPLELFEHFVRCLGENFAGVLGDLTDE